jgi:hypothetical protein
MAFNPFHGFRKHQKVVFAALTIICMLTFVMAGGSFAGGDLFSELTRWVTGRSRTQEVAVVYGRRITDRELVELRRQRRLANQFMQQAVFLAQSNICNVVQNSLSQFDRPIQEQIQTILMRRTYAAFLPREYLNTQYLNNLSIYLMQLQFIQNQLETAKKPLEQVKLIQQLQAVLQKDYWMFLAPKDELYPEDNLYFGGSTSEQGLLDFIIWRNQADRLGIHLTTDDVSREYQRETLESFKEPHISLLLRQLGIQPDHSGLQMLQAALTDEFRVRMAQAALVGYDPGGNIDQVPTSITPYDFWEYYRKNRTELSLKLLPIPVQKFVPEVKESPSESQLEALFEQYKDQEYAPDKETPGFKQPRRIKIQWVSASADSDTYRKQAQRWLLSLIAATPSNPWLPLALLEPLVSEYEALKWGRFRAPALTATDFVPSFYDYAYFSRPENVAATVGQAFGTVGAKGSVLSTLVAYRSAAVARAQRDLATVVAREAQRRLPLSGALLSAATSVQPALAFAAVWQYAGKIDAYLPMELVQGQLVRKLQENIANTLLTSSLDAFKTELGAKRKELESKKAKSEDVEKRLEKAVKEHGWAQGGMTGLQDAYEINRDAKQLAPLKEAYMRNLQFRDPKGKRFAQSLFFNLPPDQWRPFTPKELLSGASPDASAKETFVYWKTDDQPAKVLTFELARKEVEAAWRLNKARGLAKAKAEELAKKAGETHGDAVRVLNEASKEYGAVFDLNGVARWARPGPSSRAEPFPQYQQYTVPDDKIDHPPRWPNFVDPLLQALHEPGETVVITNLPKDIYYVVALARRDAPSIADFNNESVTNRELLLRHLEADEQTEYRRAFLQQLRNEAQLFVNEEGLQRVRERPSLREE